MRPRGLELEVVSGLRTFVDLERPSESGILGVLYPDSYKPSLVVKVYVKKSAERNLRYVKWEKKGTSAKMTPWLKD